MNVYVKGSTDRAVDEENRLSVLTHLSYASGGGERLFAFRQEKLFEFVPAR